jgi:predicted PurR-regulated permease PerM
MDLVSNLALGFATALSIDNLLYAFAGVLIGTLIGVLPGIGPIATLAMLLPTTYALEPTSALIMLAVLLVVHGAESIWIAPMTYRKTVALNPIATLAAVTAGAALMGIVGAIIAVPHMRALR